MNKLIKEVLSRTDMAADELNNMDNPALEKFAELLVCECAGVIQDFVTLRVPASQYPAMLKQYFGVTQ